MQTEWIVLANTARARICERDAAGGLTELADLVHPESRQKGSELNADRGGHAQKGHGGDDHHGTSLDSRVDPRRKAQQAFAREVAAYLEAAVKDGRCASWVLMASDPFLGELKAELGQGAQRALRRAVGHDYSALTGRELAQRVREVLATAGQ